MINVEIVKREDQADGNFNNGEILEKKTNWISSRWRIIQTLLKYFLLGSRLDK